MRKILYSVIFITTIALAGVMAVITPKPVSAVDGEGKFFLQVSPSPLVNLLKPGQKTTIDLNIRNMGTETENLKIAPRIFKIDNVTGELKFDDQSVPEVAAWTSFSAPNFTVQPGEIFNQKVIFNTPKDAGFSYSFAVVINRQKDPQFNPAAGRQLKGSVAIFCLINIDRPGAKRELTIKDFKPSQSIYEYLPAKLDVTLKNTGNTIVQPSGNVFIQRQASDKTPINTLLVNKNEGYILPGSIRKYIAEWDDGFPVIKTSTGGDGAPKEDVDWNWSNLSHLRIGYYTAKAVVIYNDGVRDIPLTGEVGFWVIPWKLLLAALAIVIVLLFGIWSMLKGVVRFPGKNKKISRRR